VFPHIGDIRSVSARIAARVAKMAAEEGVNNYQLSEDETWESYTADNMIDPAYRPLLIARD
jgi:malic enzyme